jgi:CheY-like chemotaxis protein
MPAHTPPLKALVVDDHDLVRLGIRQLLGARAEVTDVGSLQEARQQLTRQRFDLLLLDLGLGTDFSLSVLPEWRARPGPTCASWCSPRCPKRCMPSACCAPGPTVLS